MVCRSVELVILTDNNLVSSKQLHHLVCDEKVPLRGGEEQLGGQTTAMKLLISVDIGRQKPEAAVVDPNKRVGAIW